MRTLFRITKTELSALFFSPIAWLILIIFTFQAGMTYADVYSDVIRYQALGYNLSGITSRLFSNYNGVFSKMLDNLYLYIPLLTMGLMSREFYSGSIKLLFSSPVTNKQIIFGKYLAMIIYALILIAILSIYIIFTAFAIKNIDLPQLLSGLLGVFLVTCTYAAIGLFMSCLTSYQVVAAIGTLALLTVLNFIKEVGQNMEFVREITYWLSISGRSSTLLDGLICSEDVLYFIIVITLFLTLSILKLGSERKRHKPYVVLFRYASVIIIALLLGYISSRPQFMSFYDTTETKINTLTPNSQEVMKKLTGGLTITTYVNILEDNYWRAMPDRRKYDFEEFEKYVRFKPETEIKYVYYYHPCYNPYMDRRYPGLTPEQRVQEICKVMEWDTAMFLTPEQINRQIDLSGEGYRLVRVIERENGQKSFLRFYEDIRRTPTESEFTAALKRLVTKPPKVAFLTGHGERNVDGAGERDYGAFVRDLTFRYSLPNQGFDVTLLRLDEQKNIPEDIDILVIAEPRTVLAPEELTKIKEYIDRGGNMILSGEPYRQHIMNPLLSFLGLEFMPGILVQPSKDFTADLIFGNITEAAAQSSKGYQKLWRGKYKITMPGAVGIKILEEKEFKVTPLVTTNEEGAWNELETTDFIDNQPIYNSQVGEEERTIPVVVELTRRVGEKEQRIFVWGDADCIGNGELTTSREGVRSSNFSLITNSFGDLSYGEFPVDTSRPRPSDDKAYIGEGSEIWLKLLFMGLLPGILVFISLRMWWFRKSR